MTSSFTLPGGGVALFRAEPMLTLAGQDEERRDLERQGKVPTYWVQVKHASSTELIDVEPPNRTADYVGQIIAVAVAPQVAAAEVSSS